MRRVFQCFNAPDSGERSVNRVAGSVHITVIPRMPPERIELAAAMR